MSFLPPGICIYCHKPITWLDVLFRRYYRVTDSSVAHEECKVEPKVGE
jgi:hypothetical protein